MEPFNLKENSSTLQKPFLLRLYISSSLLIVVVGIAERERAMKYSAMFYRLFLLSALLFGLSLPAATAGRTGLQLHIRRGQKISELSGEPLITAACGGTAEFESECVSTLQSAPPHQKADSNGLAFFTLKYNSITVANFVKFQIAIVNVQFRNRISKYIQPLK